MRLQHSLLLLLLSCAVAHAEEPSGCDKFAWSFERDRAAIQHDAKPVASGATVEKAAGAAYLVQLRPTAEVAFEHPPERPGKPGTFAGVIRMPAPPTKGAYRLTLSAGAWVDVVQGGQMLKSTAHTGARDCEGARKSVRFDLQAAPLTVQFSGAQKESLSFILLPAE